MENMSVVRLLLKLSPPVMLALLIQSIYNIVDSFFISRYSAAGLTALSIIFPIQLLMTALATGTGTGINILVSRMDGTGETKSQTDIVKCGLFSGFFNYVIFACAGLLLIRSYFAISSDQIPVQEQGIPYAQIIFAGSLGLFIESNCTKILQAKGNMLTPMIAQVTGAVINVILDPILIFGMFGMPEAGAAGAALATIAGQLAAMIITLAAVFRIYRFQGKIRLQNCIRIYRAGIPSIVMQSLYTLYIIGLNLILKQFTEDAVTVLGIYYKLQTFFFIPLMGLQQVILPVISFHYGAGKKNCFSRPTCTALAGALLLSLSLTACSSAAQTESSSAQAGSVSAESEAETQTESAAAESTAAETTAAGTASSEMESASDTAQAPDTVTITSLNANQEETELTVPYDPQRIAILDMACLDILDRLGVGDRVVGSASTSLDYLQAYVTDENVSNLGTIKEADLEAVMACEPDVIFIGGRLASSYDALSEIAPVIYLSTDTELGVVESVRKNAAAIASLFGLEDQVDELMADFDSRIEALAAFAEGKTAVIGMCTSGSFNVLGNDGLCSLIGREIGFENLGDGDVTATHGNETSFELIVDLNPDYMFVLDRDAAIGTDGAQLAQDIVENELIMGTDAYKNGNIVYLEHPAVWYTAEGGITALDLMLSDLETELLAE